MISADDPTCYTLQWYRALLDWEKRIKDLEAALGRKQLEIDFLNKMIELGGEELGIDLKKKFSIPPFSGSDSIKDSTATD